MDSVNFEEISVGTELVNIGVSNTLSKNQSRKLARYERKVVKKKITRKCEQERRREKYKISRQEGGLSKDDLRRIQLDRLMKSQEVGLKVCIDLQFENFMIEKEINHLANQLKRVYSSNKASATPFHLHFLSLSKTSKTYDMCVKKNDGFENYIVTLDERGVQELFDPANVIYLSPDADNVLETLDSSKVYVIGGLVDISVKKNTSSTFSHESGLTSYRLPIAKYLSRNTAGSFKQILAVNQVFDILLDFHQSGDWKTALSKHVPSKTGFILKE